jgi:hypothetical protein
MEKIVVRNEWWVVVCQSKIRVAYKWNHDFAKEAIFGDKGVVKYM